MSIQRNLKSWPGPYATGACFSPSWCDVRRNPPRRRWASGSKTPPHGGQCHELIAGERRLRAAKLAGLAEIPAIIMEATDVESLELALIENQHRANLNPIEKARAYKVLHEDKPDKRGLSHEEIGALMGEDCKTVGNTIRLLNLCDVAKARIKSGMLSSEHGKLLLAVSDMGKQSRLAQEAATKEWSVKHLRTQIKAPRRKSSAQRLTNSERAAELQRVLLQALNLPTTLLSRRRALVASIRLDCETDEAIDRAISWVRRAMEAVK